MGRHGLHTLLSTLLVKTPTQREVFEALFADWCPDHDAAWPEEEAPAHTARAGQPAARVPRLQQASQDFDDEAEPETPQRRFQQRLLAAVGSVLLCALLAWWWWPADSIVEPPITARSLPVPLPPEDADPDDLSATPVQKVWFWHADVDPQAVRVPWRLGPLELSLLGLAALAAALAAWRRYQRLLLTIKPTTRHYRGYTWQPLPPPARDDGALIAARDRRQLVWYIEHFVSDDPTRRLVLQQTVDATARAGGFVHLRFQPAVYDRKIWFWLDRQLNRPTPRTAAQQLIATLVAAGLEAHQGWFTDVPDRVDWPAQPGYQPAHEEGHGRQALVAIFSDGTGLAHRLDNPRYRQDTERLLRSLRRWPRLCFVDCSTSGTRLASVLAPYGIDAIALEELSHWLGGVERQAPVAALTGTDFYGDARVWAAACALGGVQVATASAHSLRVALGLSVSPWLVDQVLAEALHAGQPYRLINWLLRCEPLAAHGRLQPGSLAQRALAWWQQRYAEASQRMQVQENPLLPWQNSLASQRWQLEQALLRLYDEPARATRWLARLADGALRHEAHARLAVFAAAEHYEAVSRDESRHMYLTWRFAELPAAIRHRLRQLGFAAALFKHDPILLKDSPRLALAGTVLVMLALTAFGAVAYHWFTPEPPRLLAPEAVHNHPALVAQTVRLIEPMRNGNYRVTLGSARHTVSLPNVSAGADIPVTWRWQETDNAVDLENSDSVILRAGRLAQPIRPCSEGWPQRSLVIIAAPFADRHLAARQLAIRLLDTGSADQVLLGKAWTQHLATWLGASPALNRATQVVVILPKADHAERDAAQLASHLGPWAVVSSDDLAGLARAITFPGRKAVEDVSSRLQVHRRQGEVQVYGGPDAQQLEDGIAWVSVCPGTFTMGTIEGEDEMAVEDEIVAPPLRTVILSAFQIAATETTWKQYAQIYPDGTELSRWFFRQPPRKANTMPVVGVMWEQAQAFCRQIGGDLPTEAQWEYAARGGSRFPWSFGKEVALLGHYAWFDGNSSEQAEEVGQKRPNPLGLYDMHGNVWEWAQDLYGKYTSGWFVDPLDFNSEIRWRVVRGGAFFYPPRFLRSARRVVDPEYGGRFFGFRCVRIPPQSS